MNKSLIKKKENSVINISRLTERELIYSMHWLYYCCIFFTFCFYLCSNPVVYSSLCSLFSYFIYYIPCIIFYINYNINHSYKSCKVLLKIYPNNCIIFKLINKIFLKRNLYPGTLPWNLMISKYSENQKTMK